MAGTSLVSHAAQIIFLRIILRVP
jgi:hypothetical protein